MNISLGRDLVIKEIIERRKERISKGRKGEYLFIDSYKHFKKNNSLKEMLHEYLPSKLFICKNVRISSEPKICHNLHE